MKLSIVLPVYNVEKYITDCLESLLSQDIEINDYEIVCVSDGSTDNSLEIIKDYMKRNNNIYLITKENGGVSSARNAGLKHCRGKYVWFIDPDDYIEADCLGFVLKNLEIYNADLFEVNYKNCEENSNFKRRKNVFTIDEINRFGAVASGCIYIVEKKMLTENEIIFDEGLAYGEDYLWALNVKITSKTNVASDSVIYNYRQRSSSAMNVKTKQSIDKYIDSMIILVEKYDNILCTKNDLDKKVIINIKNRKKLCVQAILLQLMLNDYSYLEIKEILSSLIQKDMYPYGVVLGNFKPSKSAKLTIVNWFSLLFSCKSIYLFCIWLTRLISNVKKISHI